MIAIVPKKHIPKIQGYTKSKVPIKDADSKMEIAKSELKYDGI